MQRSGRPVGRPLRRSEMTMPSGKSILRAGLIAVATAPCLGCAPRPPVPEIALDAPLPPLAAEFRTVIEEDGRTAVIEWRVWREADQIIIENLTERTADYWQRDGKSVLRRTLFHDERRGVEFHPGDLELLKGPAEWGERALLFPPSLLSVLGAAGGGWRDGQPYRRYQGEIDGTRWHLSVAVDWMLPLELKRRSPHGAVHTRLLGAFPLSTAPWQPVPCADYDLIDFADFGDRATDPLVARVESRLGLGHAHERERR
jgi:hypothetical protein